MQNLELIGKVGALSKSLSRKWLVVSLLLFSSFHFTINAQGTRVAFGKNVLQHNDFVWQFYRGTSFDVYYYQGGQALSAYLASTAPSILQNLEGRLDYPLGSKVTLVVYNTYDDYRQSNYRIEEETEIYASANKTKVVGNTAFVYFNGSHADLQNQVKAALARMLISDLLYGGSLQERLQSNVLLNIPPWYTEGLVRYLSSDYSPQDEARLKSALERKRLLKFKRLSTEEQTLASFSLWKHIVNQAGEDAISSMLYVSRANRSHEAGYYFVLGQSFEGVYANWLSILTTRLEGLEGKEPEGEMINIKKTVKRRALTHFSISPDGKFASLATNDMGKMRLYVLDLVKGGRKKILSTGYRQGDAALDFTYPQTAWSPNSNTLLVVYDREAYPRIFTYNLEEKKKTETRTLDRLDRILSLDYNDNGRQVLMSAVRRGQTDVFIMDPKTYVIRPVTDDAYDELSPKWVAGSRGIAFSSNRPGANAPKVNGARPFTISPNFDIYLIPDVAIPGRIKRLTYGPGDFTTPDAYDSAYVSYLSTQSGVQSIVATRLDTLFHYKRFVISYQDPRKHKNDTFKVLGLDTSSYLLPQEKIIAKDFYRIDTSSIYRDSLTTYVLRTGSENILDYGVNSRTRKENLLYFRKGRYQLYASSFQADYIKNAKVQTSSSSLFAPTTLTKPQTNDDLPIHIRVYQHSDRLEFNNDQLEGPKDTTIIDSTLPLVYFQTGFKVPAKVEVPIDTSKIGADTALVPFDALAVEDEEVVRTGGNAKPRYKLPVPAVYELNFRQDYITTRFDNSIIFTPYLPYTPGNNLVNQPVLASFTRLSASDLFKDYKLVGGFRFVPTPTFPGADYFVSFGNYKKRVDKSLTFYRRGERRGNGLDLTKVTSHELRGEVRYPFTEPSSIRGSAFVRLDRQVKLATDAASLGAKNSSLGWVGARGEYVFDNSIDLNLNLWRGTKARVYGETFFSPTDTKTFLAVAGFDARKSIKIHRDVVWATRIAGAASSGTAKVVYFLGGIDNWIWARTDANNLVDPDQNYVYKAQATNLRGYNQNIRNGNTYVVLNSEVRVPLFRYVFNRALRSPFFNDFQVVGFGDAGSAWTGIDPFGESNSFNRRQVFDGPISIVVKSPRDPFVYGYGWGLRSTILGYFVRVDFARGLADGVLLPSRTYLGIGTDF